MLEGLSKADTARLIELEIALARSEGVSYPALVHNHGQRDECALVAVCTALEVDYAEQSHRYEMENGKTFGEAARKATQMSYIVTKDWLEAMWGNDCELFFRSYPLSNLRTWEMSPDLSGVGVMTCRNQYNGDRHAVAYQDGWVYDGNAPSPLRYKVWAMGVGDNTVIDGMSTRKENEQ